MICKEIELIVTMASDDEKSIQDVDKLERRGIAWKAYDTLMEPQKRELVEAYDTQLCYNKLMRWDTEDDAATYKSNWRSWRRPRSMARRHRKAWRGADARRIELLSVV